MNEPDNPINRILVLEELQWVVRSTPQDNLTSLQGQSDIMMAFWDSYESAVHFNNALSDVDKFNLH